ATAQATSLGPTDGAFSATAKIGDGLYPLKDVDLYQFNASTGQVLTALTSLPTGGTPMYYNTLRLFDSAGNQLASYYYRYDYSARIDYQFASAGSYYVGVSGDGSYDPNVAGSGSAGYRGDYQLSLKLATPTGDTAGDTLATAQVTGIGPANGVFGVNAHIGD